MTETDTAGGRRVTARQILALVMTGALACGAPESDTAKREAAGAGASEPTAHADGVLFSDVSAEAGLDFVHVNGMSGRWYFVEMMGSGCGFIDYDNDGDLDVYLLQGHPLAPGRAPDSTFVDRLYRNDLEIGPDGRRTLRFTDVTEDSGIRAAGYGFGVATGDYDNDGWIDLYVVNWGSNQLWRNNGDGTFSDVTAASGADDPRWSTGASFVDFDRDGWLDLVVVNYNSYTLEGDRPCFTQSGRRDYCGPDAYPFDPDRIFRNRGDGTFEDVTLEMGLTAAYGPGLGVVAADFNLDGWPDIYVANDRNENQLWINDAGRHFWDQAVLAGAAVNADGMAEASMGVNAEDFDGAGGDDIFITHLNQESNTLYVNAGAATGEILFEDLTRTSGLGVSSLMYTAFGVAPLDYDNDSWLDLFIATGEVVIIPEQADRGDPLPLRQPNQLFRNLGQGRFREVTPQNDDVFDRVEVSRGVAYGDVDNDGDTDLLVSDNNARASLLRNEVGQDNAWLGLRLVGTDGRRDMLGARIAVVQPGGRTLWRRVHTDGSYASAHDPRVSVGLGEDGTYEVVRVHWPGGRVEAWDGLETRRYHTLVEGEGRAVEPR